MTAVAVGTAEDGATVVVTVSSHPVPDSSADGPPDDVSVVAAAALVDRWPPRGLAMALAADAAHVVPAEVTLTVDVAMGVDGSATVWSDGVAVAGGWDRVESTLGLFAAEHLADRVAVHAALLVCDAGAIVVPGTTHSGKSTLAAAAKRRGWLVLGDEFVLVDQVSGVVQGWPRPLRQRTPTGVERIRLDERELAEAFVDREVMMVAALRHTPTGPGFGPVTRADAVMRVLENTVCGATRPQASFRAALAMTDGAVAVEGARGEADETLGLLTDLI